MKSFQYKVGVFVLAMGLLFVGFVVYLLYAKDYFEREQSLYLTASDAEDIEAGMPLLFSGIAIGTVRRVDLVENGSIRVTLAIPAKQTKWLREDSFFWLDRPLLGGAKIRAYSPFLTSPPLRPGASRPLYGVELKKDTTQLMTKVQAVLDNVEDLTSREGHLNRILKHLETVSERMTGEHGVLGGVMGTPERAEQVSQALKELRTLLRRHEELAKRLNVLTRKTDQRLYGDGKLADQLGAALADTRQLLQQAAENLKKVDAVLANVKEGSHDLPRLRDEVEATLRKTQTLINELNNTWPFAKDKDLQLP